MKQISRRLKIAVFIMLLMDLMLSLFRFSVDPSINSLSPKNQYLNMSSACYCVRQESLEDFMDSSPKKGRSIFFHETSCESFIKGKIVLNGRQGCAIESAARLNPNFHVYLLFTSPGVFKFEGTESDRVIQALLTYKNVEIMHSDLERYTTGTPAEQIYKNGYIESSRYAVSHASDVLRYLTLWKYGGIYLDLDVIVLKSLENLGENFAGIETKNLIGSAVLSFSSIGKGHEYSEECLLDLVKNFEGNSWIRNGPGVITTFLKKICNVQVEDMAGRDCNGFTVHPPQSFNPIPSWSWEFYFQENHTDLLYNITRESYVIHVWNVLSNGVNVWKGMKVPYAIVAEKFCPKVYKELDYSF